MAFFHGLRRRHVSPREPSNEPSDDDEVLEEFLRNRRLYSDKYEHRKVPHFVIVWNRTDKQAQTDKNVEYRKVFEENLRRKGLELKISPEQWPSCVIEIDVSQNAFNHYSELLKLRQPFTDRLGTKFTEDTNDPHAFGIDRMIKKGAYEAAYRLHDGTHAPPYFVPPKGYGVVWRSRRWHLNRNWANVRKLFNFQPLDNIREYFGAKIGLYFTWLGFYNQMLVFASVPGLLCFMFGLMTIHSNKPSEDICNSEESIDMCPLCDHFCDYWDLRQTCLYSRFTYVFDNPSNIVFSIFMSVWATLFLKLWKNYSAEVTHTWDLPDLKAQKELPRPQYLARLEEFKNPEKLMPFSVMKFMRAILSYSVVLLLISVAMAAVIGVILYQMSVVTALRILGNPQITSHAILITSITAACINLCGIFVFDKFCMWLAEYLTELELHRTQTNFDASLTLKIYSLQFINSYASIFYIAFIRGKIIGYPGAYKRFLQYRREQCDNGVCFMELCIQLSIIIIVKQIILRLLQILRLKSLIKDAYYKLRRYFMPGNKKPKFHRVRRFQMLLWSRDYYLKQWDPRSLLLKYLEMVLQFGFVTMFVAAFPLAPFFALLNNVLQLRFDAKELLVTYRRPVAQRAQDIGVWYRILDLISKLSVITNGFIIAFSSNYIPKMVFQYTVSENYSLDGFLQFSLSVFKTEDLEDFARPINNSRHVDVCRYPDYREPPDSPYKYDLTIMYWKILAARFGFVVVYYTAAVVMMILVRWFMPNTRPDDTAEGITIHQHDADDDPLRDPTDEVDFMCESVEDNSSA